MKQLLAILLSCVLLSSAASAESLRTRIGAPEALEVTYHSNTGRTSIHINADVIVPDAGTVNVYEIRTRLFTREELQRISEAVFAGREYILPEFKTMPMTLFNGEVTTQYYCNPRTVQKVEGEVFPLAESSIMVTQRVMKNGMMARSEMIYYGNTLGTLDSISYEGAEPKSGTKAYGCALSVDEARSQADALAQQIAPHMIPAGQGIVQGKRYLDSTTSGIGQAYIFYYAPMYELPWNYANYVMLPDYAVPSAEESLSIIVSDRFVEQVVWTAPHEIVAVDEENVTLLPFDKVMTVASELFPLAYMHMENPLTIGVEIARVQLGYMRVRCQDAPDKLQLIPVWDFYGTLTRYNNGKPHYPESTPCNSLLTINAVDGTVIDRGYGY